MPRVLHRPAEKNRKAWLDALKLDRDFGLCHHSTCDTHGQGCEAEAKTGGSGDNHTKSKNKTDSIFPSDCMGNCSDIVSETCPCVWYLSESRCWDGFLSSVKGTMQYLFVCKDK